MAITTDSMDKSVKLSQIGFPEFTAKLVGDVFNAIVSANMSQTQGYIELAKQLSKSMTDYTNDTHEEISGTEILNFLVKIAPDMSADSGTLITDKNTNILTPEQANKINEAVSIPNTNINTNVANTTSQIKDLYLDILNSAAKKIASDKYTVLQQMIKQGLVRVIINSGEMSSTLNFEAKDSTFYQRNSSDYNRASYKYRSSVASGGPVTDWLNYASSTYYSELGVNTVNTTNTAQSNSTIQITGSVKLTFSTDYKALNELV